MSLQHLILVCFHQTLSVPVVAQPLSTPQPEHGPPQPSPRCWTLLKRRNRNLTVQLVGQKNYFLRACTYCRITGLYPPWSSPPVSKLSYFTSAYVPSRAFYLFQWIHEAFGIHVFWLHLIVFSDIAHKSTLDMRTTEVSISTSIMPLRI